VVSKPSVVVLVSWQGVRSDGGKEIGLDILVIGPGPSERVDRFEQFIRSNGHQVQHLGAGQRLPAGERHWLGAVCFDPGEANLLELIEGLREPLRYLGIPLLVVTSQKEPEVQRQICAAGADPICAPGTPDAQILKELVSRCHAQPVGSEVRAQLADPLITAVLQTLRDMVEVDAVVCSVYQRETPMPLGDISALLKISATLEGVLILSFSMTTAEALARRVFAEVGAEVNAALMQDCMGEIANVVAGQAKALLAGTPYHFLFSSPTVTLGSHALALSENMSSLVIAFESDLGGLALQVCTIRKE
jgi:chemotaxis protein CheX